MLQLQSLKNAQLSAGPRLKMRFTQSTRSQPARHSPGGKPGCFETRLACAVLTSSTILINTRVYVVSPPRRCKKRAASQNANSRQKANQSTGKRIGHTSMGE